MAWMHHLREQLQLRTPLTHRAMGNLVVAFENLAKSKGRRTWYGADKSSKAYKKLGPVLRDTIIAMLAEGQASATSPTDEIFQQFDEYFMRFKEAYPNWPEAYLAAFKLFTFERHLVFAVIDYVKEGGC